MPVGAPQPTQDANFTNLCSQDPSFFKEKLLSRPYFWKPMWHTHTPKKVECPPPPLGITVRLMSTKLIAFLFLPSGQQDPRVSVWKLEVIENDIENQIAWQMRSREHLLFFNVAVSPTLSLHPCYKLFTC